MSKFDEVFDPNTPADPGGFPVIDHAFDVETYTNVFMQALPTQFESWCAEQAKEIRATKSDLMKPDAFRKAIAIPPGMQSFATFSLLPETYNGGVIQWPGIPPEAIRKIARENIAPQVIINMRVDDVLKYAIRSTHPWKPGWQIKMREGLHTPDTTQSRDIEQAQKFIESCSIDKLTARQRDAANHDDFSTFLAKLIRDSLTYDGMAVWTDMDLQNRVRSFKCLSAYNIRLCLPQGYMGDEQVFAVGVDEAGNVVNTFTRDQLIWRTRNSRADADIFNYGYPEIEQTMRLIQGWQNALDLNFDLFTRNATPNGFLKVSGGMNQKQLDILSRIWINLKRGITKSWALPVIPTPKDGDIEVVDLSRLKEGDFMYDTFLNMVGGLFCAMYRFPTRRLGYHISGKSKDNTPPETPTTTAPGIEDYDPYIAVLLQHVESMINEYILWTRWPELQFEFQGKSPKEDARAYEMRVLTCTVDERRALSDQKPLETVGKDDDEKTMLRAMGAAPVDPALSGIYQSLITAKASAEQAQTEMAAQPGANFTSKKDPARSQDHGHMAGTRERFSSRGEEVTERICSVCDKLKPLMEFPFRTGTKTLQSRCKTCVRDMQRSGYIRPTRVCGVCFHTKVHTDFLWLKELGRSEYCERCESKFKVRTCTACGEKKAHSEFSAMPQGKYGIHAQCKQCLYTAQNAVRQKDPAAWAAYVLAQRHKEKAKDIIAFKLKALVYEARKRSRDFGVNFNIDLPYIASIRTPTCPVLGIPFVWDNTSVSPDSPTLDRFYPDQGYVKGNVFMISHKANWLKNFGSVDDHVRLTKWMLRTEDQIQNKVVPFRKVS